MSNQAPFHGVPQLVILRRILYNEPSKPEDHPGLPAQDPLWGIMRRCWDPLPSSRPTIYEILIEVRLYDSSPVYWLRCIPALFSYGKILALDNRTCGQPLISRLQRTMVKCTRPRAVLSHSPPPQISRRTTWEGENRSPLLLPLTMVKCLRSQAALNLPRRISVRTT